jgi:hypothetical protein
MCRNVLEMRGERLPGAAAIRRRDMRFSLIVLGVSWLACGAAQATAQTLPKEYAQFMSKEYQELMAAMAAAQAKAIRPGDEAMSCAGIEKELVTSMNDPAIQAYAAKVSGVLPKDTAPTAAMTPQTAAALFGALGTGAAITPGPTGLPLPAGRALTAAQQAHTAALQAQTLQTLQDPNAQFKLMMPILPQMMRAQHLVGLALTRSCPWVFGAYTGAAPLSPAVR